MKILNFFIVFLLLGCLARTVIYKPQDENHFIQNQKIYDSIFKHARSGDWLVTRGYHSGDNLVANATGIPLSHVAIFDRENELVIESNNKGVHKTALMEFIDNSYRVLIIRPRWQNETNGMEALENANQLVGKDYDYLGTIGINIPDRYYCSELAVYIYKKWRSPKEKLPAVIKPSELYLYGTILYDSLPRDEM